MVDRTSHWGNPFTTREIRAEHQALGVTLTDHEAAAITVHRYAAWLDGAGPARRRLTRNRYGDRDWIRDHLPDLVGRYARPGSDRA